MISYRPNTSMIILASGSPRRRQLLELTGWNTRIYPVEVEEQPLPTEAAGELARRLAFAKMKTAASENDALGIILAADTVVADGDRLLGKPANVVEAKEMLLSLRGRKHTVYTTLVIFHQWNNRQVIETCETIVPMRNYEEEEVERYVASGAPLDKAGAYGIQDDTFCPVEIEQMKGCYANVMGLPLCHLLRAMEQLSEKPSVNVPKACQAYTGYTCPVFHEILGNQL